MLRFLVALNENLKKQEADFRERCKIEMQKLKDKLKSVGVQTDGDEDERLQLIDETYEKTKAKLQKVRQLAAKKIRGIKKGRLFT